MRSGALRRAADSETGGALVELALALPLLVAILAGTIDFSRVFYSAIALSNAARAGALYGAQDAARSGDFVGMESTAMNSIVPNTDVTAVAARTCRCATDAGVFGDPVPCATTCPTVPPQHLVATVTVTASKTFTTLMGTIPGIPNSVSLTRSATLRVAN